VQGGGNKMNEFVIKYYHNQKQILELETENYGDYITTLKASDVVFINDQAYTIERLFFNHKDTTDGWKIFLTVIVSSSVN
jgi:hypothetical protein